MNGRLVTSVSRTIRLEKTRHMNRKFVKKHDIEGGKMGSVTQADYHTDTHRQTQALIYIEAMVL